MSSEVTLASITEANEARTRANKEYERQKESDTWQKFETIKASMSPRLYDGELEDLRRRCCSNVGDWLFHKEEFKHWSDTTNLKERLLWLEGIPGAGESTANNETHVLT